MDQQTTTATMIVEQAHAAGLEDVAGYALILGAVAAATFLAATNPFVQGYLIYRAVK